MFRSTLFVLFIYVIYDVVVFLVLAHVFHFFLNAFRILLSLQLADDTIYPLPTFHLIRIRWKSFHIWRDAAK